MNITKNLVFFLILAILGACSKNEPKKPVTIVEQVSSEINESNNKPKLLPIIDSVYDKKAAYIAGMYGDAPAQNDSIWKKYCSWMDSSWSKAYKSRYNLMKKWSNKETLPELASNSVLFYPFSGADFLNANIFFPQCKNYIMVGLEPVGVLPNFNKIKSTYAYLDDVNTSLKDILHSSFFHTKKMKVHFNKEKVNGALPILSLFIKRTGHFIINIEAIQISSSGKLNAFHYDSLESKKFNPSGAKITFLSQKDTTKSTLLFLSQDLSNGGIGEKKGFRLFLDSLTNYFCFVKSASYLMHYGYFSLIRESILANAKGLFQDDTGIPFKYLSDTIWNIKLYGKYSKPVKLFPSSKFSQTDLKLAFENDSTIMKLPFALGYQPNANLTSLILAQRKDRLK